MELHVAAKVIVKHPDKDEFLLVKRNLDEKSGYEPAGGRVEIDFPNKLAENLETCAIREVYEELGVGIKNVKYMGSYYFFWTIKENACTVCAVFLATATSIDTVKSQGNETCGMIYPLWVKVDDILDNKIFIEKQHVGLADILKKAAIEVHSNVFV